MSVILYRANPAVSPGSVPGHRGQMDPSYRVVAVTMLFAVRLWSLQTFTSLVCFKGHNYPIWDVEFRWVGGGE